MAQNFSFTGWTASTAAPNSLLSRITGAVGETLPPAGGIGPVTNLATNPARADELTKPPTALKDAKLGSRAPDTRAPGSVPIQGSVYQTNNMPAFLQSSIDSLNANQSMRRAVQAEWMTKLFDIANAAPPSDPYDIQANQQWAFNRQQAWNALMAGSVQPGASFAYGGGGGGGAPRVITAGGSSNVPRDRAVNTVTSIQSQIDALEKQRDKAYANDYRAPIASIYEGSERQKLDNQLQDLRKQQQSAASTATLATRGWTPGMPTW